MCKEQAAGWTCPLFLLCTNFIPFKLCWQCTWPFLLMAAASPGETFGPCSFLPRRASLSEDIPGQFCRDARTVGIIVRMRGAQPHWQTVAVSVQAAGFIGTGHRLREELGPNYLVEGKDPCKTFPLCSKRTYMPGPNGAFPFT